jgi:Spy/CpxP family protein refolding chaperone
VADFDQLFTRSLRQKASTERLHHRCKPHYERKEDSVKTKIIRILILTILATTSQSFAETPADKVEVAQQVQAAQQTDSAEASASSEVITNVLDTPSATPRGPQDLLQDYEGGMAFITKQFSQKVAAVTGAVQSGELSAEQGENVLGELYQVSQMQFQLLSGLHDILEQDLASASESAAAEPDADANADSDSNPARDNESVRLPIPLSPLELNPSVIQYLSLSPTQVKSIQALLADERRTVTPLMTQLQTTRKQIVSVSQQDQGKSEKQVKALAAAQARTMKKLLVANSRMRAKIYQLLSRQQQKKLDQFQNSNELLIASNYEGD